MRDNIVPIVGATVISVVVLLFGIAIGVETGRGRTPTTTAPCEVGPDGCLTVGTGVVIPHTCDLPLLHLDAEHQRYIEAARLRWKPNSQSYAIEPASGWFVTTNVSDAGTDFNAVRLSWHGLTDAGK